MYNLLRKGFDVLKGTSKVYESYIIAILIFLGTIVLLSTFQVYKSKRKAEAIRLLAIAQKLMRASPESIDYDLAKNTLLKSMALDPNLKEARIVLLKLSLFDEYQIQKNNDNLDFENRAAWELKSVSDSGGRLILYHFLNAGQKASQLKARVKYLDIVEQSAKTILSQKSKKKSAYIKGRLHLLRYEIFQEKEDLKMAVDLLETASKTMNSRPIAVVWHSIALIRSGEFSQAKLLLVALHKEIIDKREQYKFRKQLRFASKCSMEIEKCL